MRASVPARRTVWILDTLTSPSHRTNQPASRSSDWPRSVSSSGGILVDKTSKANITDTQTATFDFGDLKIVWNHRTWGRAPDPDYPWGATFYGDKGTLRASVMGYDFVPEGGGAPIHKDVTYELEQYPEDKTEPRLEKHVAPAIRQHMRDIAVAFEAGDFTKPFQVHAEVVPGTSVMAARRGGISYQEIDRPRGAEVRIRASDAAAVAAIHEFLAFQRSAHNARGHEGQMGHVH